MRISSAQFFQTGLQTINAQQADLMHLFQQIGSGQRMVTPADDPLAAAQSINISQAQALNQRHSDNRAVLATNLGATDEALTSGILLVQDLKTRLVEVANGTLSDADRASLATVLESARDTLMGIANRTDGNGQFLFSGYQGSQRAFNETSGAWEGDTGERLIQADATRQIAGNVNGLEVFAQATSGSRAFVSAAADSNTGTGHLAAPVLLDADHPWFNNTTDNVWQGVPLTLSFADNAGTLQYTITGVDADGGAISSGPHPYQGSGEILLGDAANGDAIRAAFSGQPADGDSFTVTPAVHDDADMNIFTTLDALIADLNQPTDGNPHAQAKLANSLSGAMQRLDLNYDQLLTVRATVGTRMNEVDALEASGQQRALGYSNRLSKLEDVDYYTVTSQLQLRSAALEAAALAFKQIQGTSLFSMGSN